MGYLIKRILGTIFLALFLILSACVEKGIHFNKIWVNPKGLDDAEFLQLKGPARQSLAGLSLLVIESDPGKHFGKIDKRLDFTAHHKFGSNGYYLIGNCQGIKRVFETSPDRHIEANFFENSSITVALARTESLKTNKISGSEKFVAALALLKAKHKSPLQNVQKVYHGKSGLAKGAYFDGHWKSAIGFKRPPQPGGRDACATQKLTIKEIQGRFLESPYKGENIHTTGIITHQQGRNIWLQEDKASQLVSSGIKLRYDGDLKPAVGDRILVHARVEERYFGASLSTTQLNPVYSIAIINRNQSLPSFRQIHSLSLQSIAEAIQFWEGLEGMRIHIKQAVVVGPSDKHGNVVVLAEGNRNLANYDKHFHTLLLEQKNNPIDYNPQRIFVRLSEQLALGQEIHNLEGVLDYQYGHYRLLAQNYQLGQVSANAFPQTPHVTDGISIASFNLENLFDNQDNPEKADEKSTLSDSQIRRKVDKLAHIMSQNLANPEIIVVQEVENQQILSVLAHALSKISGRQYLAQSFETSDRRGIEQGFLWDAQIVQGGAVYLAKSRSIQQSFSQKFSREPLVGEFSIGRFKLKIVAIHLKSKAGDDPLFGRNQPVRRKSEFSRLGQANALKQYIETMELGDSYLIVAGDFNDFVGLEPGETENPLTVLSKIPPLYYAGPLDFSYIYKGNAQSLDHFLIDRRLKARLLGLQAMHVNTPLPNAQRASDHDPILLHLRLNK